MAGLFDDVLGSAPASQSGSGLFDDVLTKPPTDTQGDTSRGFTRAFAQVPELAYGTGALIGLTGEKLFGEGGISTATKDYFANKFVAKQAENQQYAPTVEFTDAWDNLQQGNLAPLADWLQDSAGYVVGQGIQTVATGGLGSIVGKTVLKSATETAMAGAVAKAADTMVRSAAEKGITLSVETATQAAAKNLASAIGAGVTLFAQNLGMEAGDIYGGLTEEAHKNNREITGDDLTRAWGAAGAAAGTEVLTDMLGLGALTGRIKIGGKGVQEMTGAGGRLARAGTAAAVGMPVEGAQEWVQTGLEQYGAGKPLDTPEAAKERINAAAVGALGGGLMGGGIGAIQGAPDTDAAIRAAQDVAFGQSTDTATAAIDAYTTGNMGPTGLLGAPSAGPTLIAGEAGVGTPEQQAAFAAQQDAERLAAMTAPADAAPTGLMGSIPIVGQPTITPDVSGGRTDTTGVRADDLLIPDTAQPATEPLVVPQTRVLSDIEAYQAAQQKQVRGELLSSYERTILDAGPMATPSKLVTEPARGMSAAEIVQRQGDRIPQQPMPVTQRQLAQEEQPGVAITVAGNANGVPVISTQSAEQTSVLTAALKAVGIKPHTINDGTVRVPKATPPEALQQVIDRVNTQFAQPRGQAQPGPTQGAPNGQGLQDTQTTPEAVAVAEVFGTGAQLRTASEVPQPGERVSTTMRAALTQIGRLTGTKVVFVSAEGADGATRSKDGNTVYINVRSSINPLQVLGHETTHVLKKKHREAWAAIRAAVSASVDDMALAEFGRDYWGIANPERAGSIPTGTGLTAWLDQRPDVVGVTSTEATLRDFLMDEMISDLGGGRFSDPEFWNNVFARIEQQHGREQAKTIIQRLVAAVKELIAKFMIIAKRDGFAEFKTEGMIAQRVTPEQLREIQKAIESAYAGFISAERTNEPAGYVRGAATPATGAAPGTQGTQGDDELAELEAAQQSTPRSEFGSYPKVQALGKPRSFLPGIVRRDADDKWSFVDKKTGDEYSYPTNAQAKTAMEQMARGVQESPRRADFTNQNLPARWPTAVGSTASVNDDLRSDLATLKLDQEQYEAAVNAVMAEVGMHSPDIANGTLDEKAEHIVKRMVDNLLWLFDKIPATERNRMKLWYDGARSIAEDWAHIYNISESQAAGILAVLSPQKDWYMNVTLAERILDILDKQMGHKFDQKMSAAAFAFMSSKAPVDGDKQQVAKNKQKTRNAYDAIQGKTLEQVMATGDQLQMGLWIRSFDEAYHDPRHAIITPEGGFGEVKGTKGGEDTVRAWGSFGSIGKAASIYANGTPANINEQLGGEHKVRNFYNNIFSPKDARFITIDTHAVAAALGRALSGNDDAVADNFGKTGGTNVTGMAGTYALYYEAYVRAAKARGVLPREMQSITWEAVRGLFRPEFKGKKENVLFIDNIWQRVDAGKLTARQARNRILTDTGIDKPTWWHDDEDYVDVLSPKSYEQSRPAFEGATVVFEVAPNPDNTEQKTRWDSLPKNTKDEISYSVAWRVLSRILASFNDANMKGELHAQNGGYGPDTNASLALWFNKRASGTKIGQMLQLAGYALDQKEMMRTAHKEFDTGRVTQPVKGTKKRAADPGGAKIKSTLMDAVVIALPKGLSQAQIHDIYATIRSNVFDANGHTAGGHSTSDGSMIILNRQDDAEYGIDMTGAQLMNAIDLSLAGKYDVSHGKLHVDFASQGDNDYGIPRRSKSSRVSGKTLSGSSLRARADQFRSEAETLLETLIAAAEQRSGPDAASSRPAGESPASQSLPRYGRPADRHAVGVTGVHYSREQRPELSSRYFGTGLKGQERLRVAAATDPRIKRRLYFYANTGRGISPEADVGSHAHTVGLDNVYDMDVDPLRLYVQPAEGQPYRSVDMRMNDFESAVIDAGYDGYMTREFGTGGAVVLLGDHSVPVQYEGAGARPDTETTPAPRYSDLQKLRREIAANRALPSGRLSGLEWKRILMREMPEVDPRWLDNAAYYYKGDLLAGAEEATGATVSVMENVERADISHSAPRVPIREYDNLVQGGNIRLFNDTRYKISEQDVSTALAFVRAGASALFIDDAKIDVTFSSVSDLGGNLGLADNAGGRSTVGIRVATLRDVIRGMDTSEGQRASAPWLATLIAHELVHVRQFETGYFKQFGEAELDKFYRGKWASRPWEKQAAAAERSIGQQIIEDLVGQGVLHPDVAARNPLAPRDSTVQRSEIRTQADAIKAMTEDQRDNLDPYEFGYRGYVLYEAEKMMPKKDGTFKSVNENNSFALWQEADAVVNVDGKPFLATKQEDPDDDADEGLYVWSFSDPESGGAGADVQTDWSDKTEAVAQLREKLGGVQRSERRTPWYYSELARAVDNAPAKAFTTGKQFAVWIQSNSGKLGVKKQEIEATGITDWLQTRDRVTREDVAAYLEQGGVQLTETVLGDGEPTWFVRDLGTVLKRGFATEQEAIDWVDENAGPTARVAQNDERTGGAKFADYQLPGGTGYKEWLLTLPASSAAPTRIEYRQIDENGNATIVTVNPETAEKWRSQGKEVETVTVADELAAKKAGQFVSSHFDQPNILAHIRTNERTDADGRRVLFIEEIQSDWAQKGRKEGFGKSESAKITGEVFQQESGDWAVQWADGNFSGGYDRASAERIAAAGKSNARAGVPSAPFVTDTKSWTALALKRMISHAVEQGFDAIAWAEGSVHTGRWGTERIQWTTTPDGLFRVSGESQVGGVAGGIDLEAEGRARGLTKENSKLIDSKEMLRDIVASVASEGQDVAKLTDKLWTRMQTEPEGVSHPRKEGFEGYYDAIVPQVAKKLGATIGVVSFSLDHNAANNDMKEWRGADSAVMRVLHNGGEIYVSYRGQEDLVRSESELREYIQENGTPDGYYLGDKQGSTEQPGFAITDALREADIPLFSTRRTVEETTASFTDAVRAYFKAPQPQPVALAEVTPASLQIWGWRDLPLVVEPEVIEKMFYDHGVTIPQLGKLPAMLHRPMMIFADEKNGSLVFAGDDFKSGKVAIVAMKPDRNNANMVVTGYAPANGWDEITKRLMRGELIYRDTSKTVPESVRQVVTAAQKKYAQVGRRLPRELLQGSGLQNDSLDGTRSGTLGPTANPARAVLERAYSILGQSDLVKFEREEFGDSPRFSTPRATWTPERIDRLMSKYAYTMKDDRTKAYAAWISPDDFLNLTASNAEREIIESETRALSVADLAAQTQELFLYIRPEGLAVGERIVVEDHEGRHRMVALKRAGVTRVPVVLAFYGGARTGLPIVPKGYLERQRYASEWEAAGPGEVFDAIPIDYEHEQQLRDTFGGPGDVQFSTPRHQIPQMWQDNSKLDAWDNLTRKLQDKLIDTKRIVAAIREAGIAIKDKFDPYLQETLFHGRAATAVGKFAEDELRPLYVEMQARGVTVKEFDDYLWARHATERNAQIAKINPGMPDGGSGLTNQQAADVLAGRAVTVGTGANQRTIQLQPARMASYAALAARVDAITKRTTDLLVSSGLESQATIDKWRATYGNYVPLMRDMESDDNYSGAMNLGMGTGQGFNVKGSASKRAQGSERDVVDVLANVAMQRERAITRAEKNRVSTAVYGLALTATNPEFWLPINPDSNNPALQQKVEDELVMMGLSRTDAAAIAKEPTQTYIDKNGMTAQRINPQLRGRDNVLALRVNGQDRYVFFSSDERAQQMVRNLKNLDNEQMGEIMSHVAKVTRYFSSINTQFNPVFGLTNGIRDLGTGMLNLSSTPLKGQRKRVLAYAISALRGIYSDLRDHRAGRQPTSRWALEFEEFQREGGQTGYRDMFATSKDRAEAIAKEIQNAGKGASLLALDEKRSPIFGWLSDYNTSIENAIRLAAYKVAKEDGMSIEQSASLAKNLTVNFNKKGLAATQAGAMYAFFNAAVQGTARIGATMVKRDPQTGKVGLTDAGKKIAYGGVMFGVMQALMLSLAGYDDEEPPQFIREKNIIIPMGYRGKYISLPMPLGFHVIPNLGRIPTEFILNGFRKPGDRMVQLFRVVADAFNPIGSSTPLQMVTPTIVDPLAAMAENRDWSGKSIYKEDFNKMEPTAGWTRKKDTASDLSKWLSYSTNYITGGGKYGIGVASPTPDQIDYLIGQATGGVGRESLKLWQAAKTPLTGEDLPMYKFPVAGRFIGNTSGQESQAAKFYDNLKRIGEHDSALKEIKRAKDSAAYTEYMRENPDARQVKLADKASRDVSLLKKQKRDALEKGDAALVRNIEKQLESRIGYYNKQLGASER
jgi:hypothetical protein